MNDNTGYGISGHKEKKGQRHIKPSLDKTTEPIPDPQDLASSLETLHPYHMC